MAVEGKCSSGDATYKKDKIISWKYLEQEYVRYLLLN